MKKFIVISGVSLFLLAISFNPLFNYIRENRQESRYDSMG